MFDLKSIRDNPQAFDRGLANRGLEPQSAAILALDDERRANLVRLQEAQARRNAASKEIGKAKAQKDEDKAAALMREVADLKGVIQAGEEEERRIDETIAGLLATLPNTPRDDVPVGADETANVLVRQVGEPPAFDFAPKQHFELGEALGLMDFETASKISGARFVVLKGALARLERALGTFMLDLHTTEFGYTEVNPPLLVREPAAYGTANLPKFAEDLFEIKTPYVELKAREEERKLHQKHIQTDPNPPEGATTLQRLDKVLEDLSVFEKQRMFLIPTAEVSLTNLVRETILDEAELPKRFTAWTPCFRSEAGSAGRDVRGMIRQHQFAKVELVSITTPGKAIEEHERMTACAEEILKRLGLAYRTMLLCTGDMGFASEKTYDIEVWLPGQDTYREISSCSVCGTFQARRMSARYRRADDRSVEHVATLNGSGLAVGRTLVAVLENYQQADGSIRIPEALRPYMGGAETIAAT